MGTPYSGGEGVTGDESSPQEMYPTIHESIAAIVNILFILAILHLFYINGIGESSTIAELSNLEELETKVIQNCLAVREAAEMWATLSGGIYPSNVGVSTTPGGYTLTSLLPDGHMLENPFTGCATEPVDACAANPGETGYNPIVQNLLDAGYTITGTGALAGITILTFSYSPLYTCITIYGEVIYCTD